MSFSQAMGYLFPPFLLRALLCQQTNVSHVTLSEYLCYDFQIFRLQERGYARPTRTNRVQNGKIISHKNITQLFKQNVY